MKGLASVLIITLVIGFTTIVGNLAATAGPLELFIGAGPSTASLPEINSSIGILNTLINHLNETFEAHPNVSGRVEPLETIGTGLSLQAGERFWVLDWLGLGARLEYDASETRTVGQYEGSAVSDISIDLGLGSVGFLATGRAVFLDAGLQLAADVGAGYYYAFVDRAITFEVPAEYTDTISGIPAEGDARYSGGAFGLEAGLSLTYPVADWLIIGSLVSYQSARVGSLVDPGGTPLGLAGGETVGAITLDRVTVSLIVSVRFDLSPDGGEE